MVLGKRYGEIHVFIAKQLFFVVLANHLLVLVPQYQINGQCNQQYKIQCIPKRYQHTCGSKKEGGISFKHAIIKTLNMKQQQSFLPPAREHRIGNPLSISAQESGFDFRCFPLLTLDCLFLMACVL